MLEIVSLADLGHPSLPAPGNFLSAPSLAQAHPAGAEEIVMGGVGMLSEVSVCGVSLVRSESLLRCRGFRGREEGRLQRLGVGMAGGTETMVGTCSQGHRHLITPK